MKQRGGASGLDRVDRLQEGQGGVDRAGWNDDLHLVIEGDDGEAVAGGEFSGEAARCLAGMAELLAGHGAGAIDHQRQV